MQEESQEKLRLRLESGARAAQKRDAPVPGRFISREAFSQAVHLARTYGVSASLFGGYPEAERGQICFHPEEDEPVFTGVWLEIQWNSRFSSVSHPELLGSLMALGLERNCFGDLIAGEQSAHLFTLPEIAPQLISEWTQAGRTPIQTALLEQTPALALPKGISEEFPVASLRLDAMIAGGLHISRAKAADLIREGTVMVAHQPEVRVDRILQAGDLISIRGRGRIRVCEIGGLSRKGRTYVRIESFLHGKSAR